MSCALAAEAVTSSERARVKVSLCGGSAGVWQGTGGHCKERALTRRGGRQRFGQ